MRTESEGGLRRVSTSAEVCHTRAGANTEISKLHETTDGIIQQERQRLEEVAQQVKGYSDNASVAIKTQVSAPNKYWTAITQFSHWAGPLKSRMPARKNG